MSLSFETDPDSLKQGASEEEVLDLEHAVGEAVANARLHAYRGGLGPLSVEFEFENGTFSAVVRDGGTPVPLPAVPQSLGEGNKGRGLYLIAALMDDVQIEAGGSDQGLSLRMIKRLSGVNVNT